MERGRKRRKDDGDPATKPRKRFVWPEVVHHNFIAAVFDVGLRCASGSALMQMLPDPSNATAEDVDGHLQKFRLHRLPQEERAASCSSEALSALEQGGDWDRGVRDGLEHAKLAAGEPVHDEAGVFDDRRRESLVARHTKITATSTTLRQQLEFVGQSLQILTQFQNEMMEMVTLQRHLHGELSQRLSSLQALAESISKTIGVHDASGFAVANGPGRAGCDAMTKGHLADGAFLRGVGWGDGSGGPAADRGPRARAADADGKEQRSQTAHQPASAGVHEHKPYTPAVLGAPPPPPPQQQSLDPQSSANSASGARSASHPSSASTSSSAHRVGWHATASSTGPPPLHHGRRGAAPADSSETGAAAGEGWGDSRSKMEMEMQSHMSMHRTMLTMHMEGQLAQYSSANDKYGGNAPAGTGDAPPLVAAGADALRPPAPPSTQASEDSGQLARTKAASPSMVGLSEDQNFGDWGWMDATVDEDQLFEFLKE